MSLRAEAVALSGLAALLRAGVPGATAVSSVAAHSRGRLRARLAAAAGHIEAGQSLCIALRPALPEYARLLGSDDAHLPNRMERLSKRAIQRWSVARRLGAVGWYPALVAAGVLVVVGALAWGRAHRPEIAGPFDPRHFGLTIGLAVGVVLLVWALVGLARRQRPGWTVVLPGSQVWRLSALADLLALYGLHRDPRMGGADAAQATARAAGLPPEQATRLEVVAARLGARPEETAAVALIEGARRPDAAASQLAARFDTEAAAAAARLVAVTGYLLLVLAALGVLMAGLVIYDQAFDLARSLS